MFKLTDSEALSGYVAGLASIFFVTPIESINLRNIFHGFIATSFREPPGYLIYFSSYYKMKPLIENKL